MTPTEIVAGEVRAYMARQRRSGHSLAQELGWSDIYLSKRLTGKVPFSVNDLAAIAAALDVPIGMFFEVPGGVRKPGCYAPTMPTRLSLAAAA